MTASPAIDLEHLKRYSGGDLALEAEVFALFRQQTELWMRLLVPDADEESWASAVHALKGSARSIGAHQLALACEAAETADSTAPTQRALALQDVRECVDAALDFIDRRIYKLRIQALRSKT